MTVTSNDILAGPFAGPGIGPFSYTTYVAMESELVVTKWTGTADAELVWIDDYTVDLAAKQVTLNVALTATESVFIQGNPEPTQGDVPTTQPHFLEVAEARADKITRRQQRRQASIDRSLKTGIASARTLTDPPDLTLFDARPKLLAELDHLGPGDVELGLSSPSTINYDRILFEIVRCRMFEDTGGLNWIWLRPSPTSLGGTDIDSSMDQIGSSGTLNATTGLESENQEIFLLGNSLDHIRGDSLLGGYVLYNRISRVGEVCIEAHSPALASECLVNVRGHFREKTTREIEGFHFRIAGGSLYGTLRLWGMPKV